MFLNNASTRSIRANDENATVLRSKFNGDNVTITKKAAFKINNRTKTPSRNRDGSKSGQTTQRRRRAFGDISNRKAIALNTKVSNDSTQGVSKPGNVTLMPLPSSTNNRKAQVKLSNPRGLNAGPKREQLTSSTEYDGVLSVTTRWSSGDIAEESRSPFDLVPKEELNLVSDFRDEMMERQKEQSRERDRAEIERCEQQLSERIRQFHIENEKDIEELGTVAATYGEEDYESVLLKEHFPWEEEDEKAHSFAEQDSSLLDSLWGDM